MQEQTVRTWLALFAAPGIGPATVTALIKRFGTASAAIDASASDLRDAGLSEPAIDAIREPDPQFIDHCLGWLQTPGAGVLTAESAAWPSQFHELPGAPVMLFVRGDIELLTIPSIAIVGSRNPTQGGADNARAFAKNLASHGLAVVSGVAAGIDAAAHLGALDAEGATIGVLGTGPDIAYPARNRDLHAKIATEGLIVSEYAPGTKAHAGHFPARNRIISGLSLGTLVVEATPRSGSLITARLAGEQGRAVFAIPGSIHNPMARGCHQLIRQGAQLVEQVDDIFVELGPQLATEEPTHKTHQEPAPSRDGEYDQVLDALGWDPVSAEKLVERTGLTAAELSSMLLIMELEGVVAKAPGGEFQRCRQE
ncbi:MAG: DNA-processing protein DprA [Pseudomonadota bacterium]